MSIFNITFSYRSSQSANQSGFLLIELVLTILLVSFLGFYLCGWYSQLINMNRESMVRSRAIILACSLVDKFKINKNIDLEDSNNNSNFSNTIDNFEIDYKIKNFEKNFNFLEVKVSWQSYLGKKTFIKIVSGYAT